MAKNWGIFTDSRDFSDTSGTKTWARATCERSKRLEFRLGCIVFWSTHYRAPKPNTRFDQKKKNLIPVAFRIYALRYYITPVVSPTSMVMA